MDVIDQSYALRFFRGDHFARQAKFVRHALAAQPRQPLRSAVTRQDPSFTSGCPSFAVLLAIRIVHDSASSHPPPAQIR